MSDLHALSGYGLAFAFFSACLGVDGVGQLIFFAFGISWGRMFIRIDEATTR